MNFWLTEITCNWVSMSNKFFTCTETWGQGNVYSYKETDNKLLWTFWVFGFKFIHIMPMSYHWFKISEKSYKHFQVKNWNGECNFNN